MPRTPRVTFLFMITGAMACGSSQAGDASAPGPDAAPGGGGDAAGDESASGSSGSGGGAGGSSSGPSGSSSGPTGSRGADSGSGASSGGARADAGAVQCRSPVLAAGDRNESVTVGSSCRTYILHVPSSYAGASAVPLVVDFHALGGSGTGEEGTSPYKAQTDPEGVITSYPNGLSGPAGAAWNVGPCCVANVDDVAFARALVAQVETEACIDAKRIYAVGFSMGGGMSHYLACHAADLFAAVAPAAFDLLQENVSDCTPLRPIAEMSFRDTGDPIVPYAGGASSLVPGMPVTFLGAAGTFQKWAQIDGCTGSPSTADANGCQFYSACQGGVKVALCTKQGGTHEPGNASVGWPFLKQYTLL
jgi:polyhydroxybutyrate depolymerase